jgi:hypothetical protein
MRSFRKKSSELLSKAALIEVQCAVRATREARELNIPGTLAQRRLWVAGRKKSLMAEAKCVAN